MKVSRIRLLLFLALVLSICPPLFAQEGNKAGSILFIDAVFFNSRFELFGDMDHDIVDIQSPGIQITYYKSFGNPGIFVQSTVLFPGEVKTDPAHGSDTSELLDGGTRIGLDMLAGPGWVFQPGPMVFFAGGGFHYTGLFINSAYGYSVGLGLSGRVVVPFTKMFHMQLGFNFCYDLFGDLVYGDYHHYFYRAYTLGFSAGFGLYF